MPMAFFWKGRGIKPILSRCHAPSVTPRLLGSHAPSRDGRPAGHMANAMIYCDDLSSYRSAGPLIEHDTDPLLFPPDDGQGRFNWALGTKSVKRSGMNNGVSTWSAAPVSNRLRTVQSMPPPPKSIVPAFKMRRRGAIRCSFMVALTTQADALLELASMIEAATDGRAQRSRPVSL
jgi:hypothetical protein